MSPGNLYYHYGNKEDIVRGLFERLSAEWRVLDTLPEDRGPTLTDLDGMLRGHFQALWRYVGVAVGEHLGFFFTALWTAMVAGLLLRRSPWLRRSGTILAVGIAAGPLEPFGVAAAGSKLVVMDNLYAYGPPEGPMTETTLRAAQGPKGRLRAQLEEFFLEAHRRGRVRLTIGRASDFYGAGANSQVMILAVTPALRGRRAFWPGSRDVPHTLNYLPDVGRGLVTLGEREEALGEVWHLPAAEPLTGRQFMEVVFQTLGRPMRLGVITQPMMRFVGMFSPLVRESAEVLYQFERPFIMDTSKFERAFGAQVAQHREAIQQIVRAR